MYALPPKHATGRALVRGTKPDSAPHTTGRLLIAAAIAVAALAAVGMSETAMAQTSEIKVGVLSASDPIFEEGPNRAMELARDAWNREAIPQTNTELNLNFINIRGNVSDPAHQAFVSQEILKAASDGYTHFLAPSDEASLLLVHGIVSSVLPNSILVSPASQATFFPSLYADDNLFRLVPNGLTQGRQIVEQFDREGIDRALIVTDAALANFVNMGGIPDDVHDHYVLPSIPLYGPGDTELNAQSLTALNDKLVDLFDQHDKERLAVLAATTPSTFIVMAHAIAANPQLDALDDVKWFGYHALGHSPFLTHDPVAAAFADDMDMRVIVYEIAPNEFNAPLANLPAFSPAFRNYNFASYDAIHLLADTIAISQTDTRPLKDIVFDVANNNLDSVDHATDRTLGHGAIGDYMLDPATGDLIESRDYVTYHVVQSGDRYVWAPVPATSVCR